MIPMWALEDEPCIRPREGRVLVWVLLVLGALVVATLAAEVWSEAPVEVTCTH